MDRTVARPIGRSITSTASFRRTERGARRITGMKPAVAVRTVASIDATRQRTRRTSRCLRIWLLAFLFLGAVKLTAALDSIETVRSSTSTIPNDSDHDAETATNTDRRDQADEDSKHPMDPLEEAAAAPKIQLLSMPDMLADEIQNSESVDMESEFVVVPPPLVVDAASILLDDDVMASHENGENLDGKMGEAPSVGGAQRRPLVVFQGTFQGTGATGSMDVVDDADDSVPIEPTDDSIPISMENEAFVNPSARSSFAADAIERDMQGEASPQRDDDEGINSGAQRADPTYSNSETVDNSATSGSASGSSTTGSKRLWGADHHSHQYPGAATQKSGSEPNETSSSATTGPTAFKNVKSAAKKGSGGSNGDNEQQQQLPPSERHIPFVKSKASPQHERIHPPEGFTLAARVYIDSKDNMAHFDYVNDDDSDEKRCDIALPYYDCGASGSTTAALPVKHAYFRHALSSAPTVWHDANLHPVLAIALTPLQIQLDSGEAHNFEAGDVILLEDSLRPGHQIMARTDKMASTTTQQHRPQHNHVSLLFITLPKPQYHVGKQHLSLRKYIKSSETPCRDIKPKSQSSSLDDAQTATAAAETSNMDSATERHSTSMLSRPTARGASTFGSVVFWDARRLRLVAFGTVALSLSTLMADFLAKTAPLWLAVGVGGTFFVVGATYGLTAAGDYLFTTWELWREQQRLDHAKRRFSQDTVNEDS